MDFFLSNSQTLKGNVDNYNLKKKKLKNIEIL